jgi:ketosteroid isomerase-like protein
MWYISTVKMMRASRSAGRVSAAVLLSFAAGAGADAVQPRDTASVWAWVDRYYADYAAMSAAPIGAAMDRWLAHYAAYAFFEDPTLGQSGMGPDQIRKPYVEAFTGPLGPVRWTILRRVAGGEWVAVEGWLHGTQTGKPVRTRFTTWLKIRNGRIVHQIDYLDYAGIRRQVAGGEAVPSEVTERPATLRRGARDVGRALKVADEFYRRYDAVPLAGTPAGLARFVGLMTEDFAFEDPTSRLRYDSRDALHASLKEALASGNYGPIHWEIDRRITDGEWVAHEGSFRGVYRQRPFATRFTTWLQLRGDRIAHQIDYVDYATFRKQTSPPAP